MFGYFLVTLLSVWVLACYIIHCYYHYQLSIQPSYTLVSNHSIISFHNHLVPASKTTASFHRRLATFTVANAVTVLVCSTISILFAGITTVPCPLIISDAIPACVTAFIGKTVATPTAGHRFYHTTIRDAAFI